jgi:hypothetical protein
MPESYNKQPVFTSTPFLWCRTMSADINNDSSNPDTWISASYVEFGEPTLVERITISACGDTINFPTVAEKLVYVFLYSSATERWSLYKTLAMPATAVDDTTPNPELEITMNGGILLTAGDRMVFAISNYSTQADQLAITVEGGTYRVV